MKEKILKAKIKQKYGKFALSGNSESCCSPECCSGSGYDSKVSSFAVGYGPKELESIPESANLGLGSGAPLNFANLKEGKAVTGL
jgi:arsenite methyltransferase